MGEVGTFGRRLRYFRRQKGMTQGELSRLASVSRVAITLVENGKQGSMDIESIVRIADALGVSVDRLVRDDALDAELTAASA
jgi:transcriptional regulator with XRE-family HTH domain